MTDANALVGEKCADQDSLSVLSVGCSRAALDNAGDAATEGGEAGFSVSPESFISPRRWNVFACVVLDSFSF